ncbi:MAG: hydrogenase maturation protease [bacterium]
MHTAPPLLVAGIGNPLMGDEGVGPAVVEAFLASRGPSPLVEAVDAGTGGMSLLYAMEGRSAAILVDCARMGESPGTMRRFTPEDVRSAKELPGISLHEGDLLDLVHLGERLEMLPSRLVILGVEPSWIGPGGTLSPVVRSAVPSCVRMLCDEVDLALEGLPPVTE